VYNAQVKQCRRMHLLCIESYQTRGMCRSCILCAHIPTVESHAGLRFRSSSFLAGSRSIRPSRSGCGRLILCERARGSWRSMCCRRRILRRRRVTCVTIVGRQVKLQIIPSVSRHLTWQRGRQTLQPFMALNIQHFLCYSAAPPHPIRSLGAVTSGRALPKLMPRPGAAPSADPRTVSIRL